MSFQVIQNELWWNKHTSLPSLHPTKKGGRDLRTIKFSLYWKNKRATEFTAETAIVFTQKLWEAKENQSESRLNKNNQNERS